MREITKYEADDGTLFEDECDCLEYEWGQKMENDSHLFTLLSEKRIVLDNSTPSSYDDCYFIYLKNSKSAKALSRIWDGDIIGSYCPDFLGGWNDAKPGLWAFDEDADEWYHVGERIANLQDMANECMEAVNGG